MPSGENSFYLDRKATGQAYETLIAKELRTYVAKTFGLSDKKEDVLIGGLSMGGFGAIRIASKYPQWYSAVFGLSSAMLIEDISILTPTSTEGFPLILGNYEYYQNLFGDVSNVIGSEADPAYFIRRNREQGIANPPYYMACGTEDALLPNNHRFRDFLNDLGEDLTYTESTGIHNWKFWNEYLEPAIVWALKKQNVWRNKAMKQEPIMIFHIECYNDQVSVMNLSNGGRVCMIPFGGTVESELFTGKVLPGAADIQVMNTAGVNHMCAKYMFEGTDCKGNPCHLFVENNGYFERDSFHNPFEATPTMMTDSKELEDYLMGNHFRSEGHGTDVGVDIYIYDTKKKQE